MDVEEIRKYITLLIPILILAAITAVFVLIFSKIIKKHPKFYTWMNLPVIIYPYVYMVTLLESILAEYAELSELAMIILFGTIFVIHPLAWAALIIDFKQIKSGNILPKSLANSTLLAKTIQIPAYIIHFIIGAFGSLASVWGIGFVLFAIIIDLLTIILSGIMSLANVINLRKQKVISLINAILVGVASFIYCIDVVAAIYLKIIVSKKLKTAKIKVEETPLTT